MYETESELDNEHGKKEKKKLVEEEERRRRKLEEEERRKRKLEEEEERKRKLEEEEERRRKLDEEEEERRIGLDWIGFIVPHVVILEYNNFPSVRGYIIGKGITTSHLSVGIILIKIFWIQTNITGIRSEC